MSGLGGSPAEPYACVIFNLDTVHTPTGLEQSAEPLRLIDLAIRYGGPTI